MNMMRLKANMELENLNDRLQYDPEIIEFFLNDTDMARTGLIRERIRMIKERGIKAFLHHPSTYKGSYLDILSKDPDMYRFYRESSEQLAEICREEDAKCIIHANYVGSVGSEHEELEGSRLMKKEIQAIAAYAGDRFLWEDSTEGLFCYANPYLIEEVIAPLNLSVNVDVSHTFIAFRGDNGKLEEVLQRTAPYAAYYHLVDSMGETHDSLMLGQGKIDWRMVKPYVLGKDFIFEIGLAGDHSDCTPMVESARFFEQI
jgi:sugar phosphate isomerase/epimerase